MSSILSNLRSPEGSNAKPLRKGRGVGSGLGKTAGKGQKGQKARHPGNFGKLGFQGGQTPIQRRLPKRGFRNKFAKETEAINLRDLEKHFQAGATIDLATTKNAGLIHNATERLKVLGVGDLSGKFVFKVHAVSASAREKILKAGGTIEILAVEPPSK